MKAVARARFVKVPPRKARYIADLIRGKTVNQALSILMTVPRNASRIIEKTLDSAVANAIQKAEGERLDVDELVVQNVIVDEGPTTMRWRPCLQSPVPIRDASRLPASRPYLYSFLAFFLTLPYMPHY